MKTPVSITNLGDGVSGGVFAAWLKSEGDVVQAGEPIAEVMTDKVNLEIESPESGVLRGLQCAAEDPVEVGQVIAEVEHE